MKNDKTFGTEQIIGNKRKNCEQLDYLEDEIDDADDY